MLQRLSPKVFVVVRERHLQGDRGATGEAGPQGERGIGEPGPKVNTFNWHVKTTPSEVV